MEAADVATLRVVSVAKTNNSRGSMASLLHYYTTIPMSGSCLHSLLLPTARPTLQTFFKYTYFTAKNNSSHFLQKLFFCNLSSIAIIYLQFCNFYNCTLKENCTLNKNFPKNIFKKIYQCKFGKL